VPHLLSGPFRADEFRRNVTQGVASLALG